jgi:hypothetical protein
VDDPDARAIDAGGLAEGSERAKGDVGRVAAERASFEVLGRADGPSALTAMVEGEALNIMNTPTGASPALLDATSIRELMSP